MFFFLQDLSFLVKTFGGKNTHPSNFQGIKLKPHETNKQVVNGRQNGLRKSTTYGASSALQKDLGRFSKHHRRRLFGPETRGFASDEKAPKKAPGNGWYLKFVHHDPLPVPGA